MDNSVSYPNRMLQYMQQSGVSYKLLEQQTHLARVTLSRYAHGRRIIPAEYRATIAAVLCCSVDDLAPQSVDAAGSDQTHIVGSTDDDMKSRRQFLADVTLGASALLIPGELWDRLRFVSAKPAALDQQTLLQLERLHDTCWQFANANQLELVERILPAYLPQVVALARQSNAHQAQAARLASQSYILAAEVEKSNLVAMQAYAQQAVVFSQVVEDDPAVQTDALRQEATIALVAKQPSLALLAYQKALPLTEHVSPLLRSRIYLGLASAYARCGQKQEALRYLGLAEDHFPDTPEEDPHYLYLYSAGSRSVLHLYQALTYTDLQRPGDAWNALVHVDGLTPKLPVTESARIEFLNLQAQTAVLLGSRDESCTYLKASVDAANAAGYPIWIAEAADVYRNMTVRWPREKQVKNLAELF